MPTHLLLTFLLGWIATVVPIWSHKVPTFWLWGALGGGALALTMCMASRLTPQRSPVLLSVWCAVLISLAMLFDFWRLPPAFILAQCRAYSSEGLAADIGRNIKTHWNWFSGTNIAMLLWIWFMSHPFLTTSGAGNPRQAGPLIYVGDFLRQRMLRGLGLSVLMIVSMELTMTVFDSLARGMQKAMSADGFVSAMLCGMAMYHVLLELFLALAVFVNSGARRVAATTH
jgi:hypothetical protein